MLKIMEIGIIILTNGTKNGIIYMLYSKKNIGGLLK